VKNPGHQVGHFAVYHLFPAAPGLVKIDQADLLSQSLREILRHGCLISVSESTVLPVREMVWKYNSSPATSTSMKARSVSKPLIIWADGLRLRERNAPEFPTTK